jgi:class 3 adenylate cyclase
VNITSAMVKSKKVSPSNGTTTAGMKKKNKNKKNKKYSPVDGLLEEEESSFRSVDYDHESGRVCEEESAAHSTSFSETFSIDKNTVTSSQKYSKNPVAQQKLNRRQLASFYPQFLIEKLKKSKKITSQTFFAEGAVMIADISGFVKLCGRLSALGVDGLDELSKYTNSYIGDLVDTVYRYGGDVVSFAGDAIICVFLQGEDEFGETEGACCQRAVRCSMELKDYESLDLTAHIAVSYGEICFAMLGGFQKEWIYLINGECVIELGPALTLAKAKESVCTHACYMQCTSFDEEFMEAEQLDDGNWNVRSTKEVMVDITVKKENLNTDKIDLHAFVPPCVNAAVLGGSFAFLSELREVTTMFLLLDSYSPKKNKDLLTLQPFFYGIQKILKQTGGFMRQFLVDDKGCVLIAIWGVPKASHVNNCSRALQACVLVSNLCQTSGQQCSIGLTTGDAYCGTVGSSIRQDYVAMGDPVNMAARLMCKAKGRIIVDTETHSMLPRELAASLNLAESMMLKGKTEPIRPYYYAEDFLASMPNFDNEKKYSIVLDPTITIEITREIDLLTEYQKSIESKEVVLKEGTMPDVRILHIEGAPGSGKTECANRFVELSKARELRAIRVRCYKNEQNMGYCIFRKIIVALMGPVNFTTEARQTEAVMTMLHYAFPNLELEEAVKKHFALLKLALNLKWNFSTEKFTFPVLAKLRAFTLFGNRALSQIMSALFQVCCTTIVIEDAHFCDDLSWKEITQSLTGLKSPLVVMLTFRQDAEANMNIRKVTTSGNDCKTGESGTGTGDKKELYNEKTSRMHSSGAQPHIKRSTFFGGGAKVMSAVQSIPKYGFGSRKGQGRHLFFKSKYNCKSLVIPLLQYDDVHYIISSTLDEDVPKFLAETVLEVSGGNAYWVKSISRFIKHTGIDHFTATMQDNSVDPNVTAASNMRKRLERHIVCHLEMFTSKVQSIAKYASLIGEEFNGDLLKAILPESVIDDESDLQSSLHTLSEEGIIFLIASKPPVYAFHNEIIRNTLYDFVLPSEAAVVHQKIAQTMEKMFKNELTPYYAFLSYHYAMSPVEMKPYAFYYIIRSVDLELSSADFTMAYTYLQYALTFMEYQIELEVISKVTDSAVADIMNYRGSTDSNGVTEEEFKNYTKLKLDFRSALKSHKFGGVEMKSGGDVSIYDEEFLHTIKASASMSSVAASSLGGDDDSVSGSAKTPPPSETTKKSGMCIIS